ncbi:MAG: hypothetical protein K5945_00570, partial [Bacteroidaceae bacterium]|nr:hypothetical protein [Bacteroidaceae bacterium]
MSVWALEPNAEGVYEIATGQDLADFAALVNGGQYEAKAKLMADIDMTGVDVSAFPIGGSSTDVRFKGVFDGQGYKISHMALENVEVTNFGMFNTGNGVVLKDFVVDATCSIIGGELVGLIGRHDGAGEFTNVGNCAPVTGEGNNVGGFVGGCWGAGNGTTVPTTFTNCWTAGNVTTKDYHAKVNDTGAISGWFNNGKFVFENFWTTAEVAYPKSQTAYLFRNGAGASFTYTNCYSLYGQQANFTLLTGVTQDDLTTGGIAYKLNGDQTKISWYQTLGEDLYPVPYETHKQVYLAVDRYCDGSPKGNAVYSNSNSGTQDDHVLVDGICKGCGLIDAKYMTPNENGWFELATPSQLKWFASRVSLGDTEGTGELFNAMLTADIDLTDTEGLIPIGTESYSYKGTFDGQGHKITGFHLTATSRYSGLFGVTNGATIGNFSIQGKLVCKGAGNGVIGSATGGSVTRIFSMLEVDASASGVTHSAGVVGECFSETYISQCAFGGKVESGDNNHDCFGGVCGYTNTGWLEDCINYGTVTYGRADAYVGGVLGYLNNTNSKGTHNCLNVGVVQYTGSESPTYGGAIIGRLNGHTAGNFGTSYWLESSAPCGTGQNTLSKAVSVTAEQLASGAVAWQLNGESFLETTWFQTIGRDDYPTIMPGHGIVYQADEAYDHIDLEDENTYFKFRTYMIEHETSRLDEIVAAQAIVDANQAVVDGWESILTFAEFCEAYTAASELRKALASSETAYKSYIEACEYAINYLAENNLTGAGRNLLDTYLSTSAEPGGEYPNGSYLYIINARALDDEAVAAEVAFVNSLIERAVAENIVAGSEITKLMANSDFTSGFDGWTTEYEGGSITTGGETALMTVARGLNNKFFDFNQTVSDLPNGIYMLAVNGMFRASADITSEFYAGQIYLNGTANYVMAPGEDLVSPDDAQDGVNCYLTNDALYEYGDVSGYVPASIVGCSYAYSAGRYQNYCAAEVKDGMLTVGIRSLGNDMSNSWLPFGNVRIFYLGTPAEAADALTPVVEGFVARATTIIEYEWSDGGDFAQYPNISESLKQQLAETVEAAGAATTGEEKMAVIDRFSALFTDVHNCRMAYIELAATAENLMGYLDNMYNAQLITKDVYDEWLDKALDAWKCYSEGSLSADEAHALAESLNASDMVLPVQNGYYQLASAEDLMVFAQLVGSGLSTAKAVLTSDVDLSEVEIVSPIGNSSYPFAGTFDGQGHKIRGFHMEVTSDRSGLFGFASGAEISNFSIDGILTCPSGGSGIGVVGWSEGSTVSNVHSTLTVTVTGSDVHHVAGIVGSARTGTRILGSTFSGSLTVESSVYDCFGGVAGYTNEDCYFENCANYGDITYTAANCYVAGICGYLNNSNFRGIKNCLNVGQIKMADGGTPTYGGAIMGRLRTYNDAVFGTCYWLEGTGLAGSGENNDSHFLMVSADRLASGEICYALNKGQEAPAWYQTLGEDPYPVLDNTHKLVYMTGEGTYTNEETTTPDGSKDNPFVVKSAADMSNLINLLVSGRMNYVVMEDDVDMSGVTDWKPLFNIADQSNGYPFIDFDGKGHVIRNLTSNLPGSYDYPGIFGVLCGNVRNLGVENADVTSGGGTGILAGYLGHNTYGQPCYVENVWVTGKVTATGYCGGMFGNIGGESHILNCYANVEVNGSGDLTGGIIGRVRGLVDMVQVYAAGSINRGGGIIGGGQQDATPLGSYKHVAVWNNTENNFGPTRAN